jgi:hypothetical protein
MHAYNTRTCSFFHSYWYNYYCECTPTTQELVLFFILTGMTIYVNARLQHKNLFFFYSNWYIY